MIHRRDVTAPGASSTRRAHLLALLAGTLAYSVVVALLVGTSGDPEELVDAVENLSRFEGRGVALLFACAVAAGAAASWLVVRGRVALGASAGAVGAYVAGFLAHLAGNDFLSPVLVATLALVWTWLAVPAGAVVPLLLAAWLRRRTAREDAGAQG